MKSIFQELIKLNICKTSQVRDPDPAIYNQSKFFKCKSSLQMKSLFLRIGNLLFIYIDFTFQKKMGKSLKAKSYLSFLLCCNNFLLPFVESLLCITVMYYNIKTVITISLLYVKYKYMYQDLLLFLNDNDRQLHHIQ